VLEQKLDRGDVPSICSQVQRGVSLQILKGFFYYQDVISWQKRQPATYIFIAGIDIQTLGGVEKRRRSGDVISYRIAVQSGRDLSVNFGGGHDTDGDTHSRPTAAPFSLFFCLIRRHGGAPLRPP